MRALKVVGLVFLVALVISGYTQLDKLPKIPSRPAPQPPPIVEAEAEPEGHLARTIGEPGSAILPEVERFLGDHPEFGKPATVYAAIPWARGTCQRVKTDAGRNVVVYLIGTTVDRVLEGGKMAWERDQP